MGWRVVVVSSRAKLDYKMDYLVIRAEDNIRRLHLSEISVLMIESTAVSMTAYLLTALCSKKIDVIFCDEKRLPTAALNSLYGSHDTSLKFRNQIMWDSEIKEIVWAEIVRAKICGQARVLSYYDKDKSEMLLAYKNDILPGDKSNREGHAAKVYFNSLFGQEFSRSDDNSINAALNYGYSIILSATAREIVSCGYSTQLGLFHNNMFNQFNFASDLMEPFRPFIDHFVAGVEIESFNSDIKMSIVNLLNRQIIINGKHQYLINAISIYVKSIFEALNERDIANIYFPEYELQIYEDDIVL